MTLTMEHTYGLQHPPSHATLNPISIRIEQTQIHTAMVRPLVPSALLLAMLPGASAFLPPAAAPR